MTDSTPASGQLVDVKDVVAANIVAALGMQATADKVAAVRQHVEDEMNAIQTHFALAVKDIQQSYAVAVADVKTTYSFVKAHPVAIGVVTAGVFLLGALAGHAL